MDKLTNKQREFVRQKLEHPGISDAQAALAAGYAPSTADSPLANITGKLGVQKFIEGIASDELLQKKLNEGLESYKVDITGDRQPDFKTRLDYIREMLGLKGYKQEVNLNQFNVGGDMNLEFTKNE